MLNKIKRKLTVNKKNIAKISSGTLIGQAISIITLPILTRIYGVEIIGVWAFINSVAQIVNPFSDLGMMHSIMVEEEKNIKSNYKVITTVGGVVSIIASSLFIFYSSIFNVINEISILFLFFLLVFTIFTKKQLQVCYSWLNRKRDYNILMINPILNNGIYGVIAIILGLLGMTTYGYFIGYIVGMAVTLLHMKKNLPNIFFTKDISECKEVISRNKQFVVYQMPNSLLANFKEQLPVLLIQGIWGSAMVGYYSITMKVLQIPGALLAQAIGKVFFQITATMKREGKVIGEYVYKNLITGMKIAIIPMSLLIAFGDVIILVFIGRDWVMAGDFIRILAIQSFFMFLMQSVQGLAITLNKQNYRMISNILQIIGYIIGAVIGNYVFHSIYIALFLMALIFIVINMGYFSALFKVMNISRKKYISSTLLSILCMLIISFGLRLTFEYLGIIEFVLKH